VFHANGNIKPTRGRRLFFLIVAILAFLSIAQSAFASPIKDKQRKAAQIAAQIESTGNKISILAENYNNIEIQLSNLKTSITDTRSQLDAAKAENDEVKSRVQKRAVTLYTSSEEETTSPTDSERRDQYADIATGNDSDTITQLQITQENVAAKQDALQKQLNTISEQEKNLSDQKKQLQSVNAQQKKLLDQTKGDLAKLIRQQQVAAASKATKKSKKATANQTFPKDLPAPSGHAAAAIAFARAQLGKPYHWAAAGPGSFDCSGLTMRAWQAGGISLPHSSSAQYAMFPHIPLTALQPGDLVFNGSGSIHHVGLYIGNGLMIHAPETGDVVKIAPIGNARAARPN
jgi:cell wall-associated NlpC family hydrolase